MAEQNNTALYSAEIQALAQRFPDYSLEEIDTAARETRSYPYGYASFTDLTRKLQRNRSATEARKLQQQREEDVSDPTPLIRDTANALPEGSKERNFFENLLATIDSTASKSLSASTTASSQALRRIISVSRKLQNSIESTTISAVTGIQAFQLQAETAIFESLNVPTQLADVARPVSSALGSTFNTTTAILKDPLGAPQYLSNALTPILDKINPNIVNQLDAASKTIGASNLAHLPSKMMGSIRNLATAADAILSMPFELLSDMYNGLLEIMEAIADSIDGIVSAVINLAQKLIYQILDSIIPLSEIMTFLETIGEIASQVGAITSLIGGFNVIADITNQVGNFASFGTDILGSPLQTALQYIPGASNIIDQGFGSLGQVTDALRDPEQFVGNILPPELGNQLSQISQIPGLGFVGNLGYSVGDTLDTLSDGVFGNISKQFANQLPMVAPLFNKKSEPSEYDFAQEPHGDGYVTGSNGEPLYQNGLVPQVNTKPTEKIFKEQASTNNEKIQAYGMTFEGNNVTAPGFSYTESNGVRRYQGRYGTFEEPITQ